MDRDILESAVNLRHELHRHPELSMKETWTKQHLMEYIRNHTDLSLVDKGRWFYAVYRKDPHAKNIAFRADFDAVPVNEDTSLVPYASQNPGAAHKCGHDGHSAALCAFAEMIDRYGADCNICFLFQHAEETGQGAEECLELIDEEQIDEIYAVHNMPGLAYGTVAADEGVVQYASTGMILQFIGQKSHACYPEDGRNPAFAMSEMILSLEELRKKQNYSGLTLITVVGVKVGDHAFGTSAGEGELLLTIRGEHEEELEDLVRKIEELAEEKAEGAGLTWTVQYEDRFSDCFNHTEPVNIIRKAAEMSGIQLEHLKEPFRASEDFGRFTKKIPGAIFYAGDGESHPALHTPQFDFPDGILPVIADLYSSIAEVSAAVNTIESEM